MATAGLVFSNIHDKNVSQLTSGRTMASVPFGGRYRLIDFVLSNMVNAGITKVGVITKSNYQSLMKHVGSGKDWDLARKNEGVIILSPFGEASSGPLYTNRLEALQNSVTFIEHCDEDYFIMSDCDIVCNLPFDKILEFHKSSGADITGVYAENKSTRNIERPSSIFEIDAEGRITDLKVQKSISGKKNFSLNVWVFNSQLLKDLVRDSIIYGTVSLSKFKVMGYEYTGHLSCIDTLTGYFEANMALLDRDARQQLFHSASYPVYTKVKDSAPTKYGSNARVKNSIIADGCRIDGIVENSILFRDVSVAQGAVIRNSIVMQDCVLERNSAIDYLVMDKRVVVRGGRYLSGCEGHPFFIDKNSVL